LATEDAALTALPCSETSANRDSRIRSMLPTEQYNHACLDRHPASNWHQRSGRVPITVAGVSFYGNVDMESHLLLRQTKLNLIQTNLHGSLQSPRRRFGTVHL
jgi:hypothetical protein